ncbi:hypothetical protein REPUB_Repub02eG0079900 [Reevesia pubescens]
MASSGSGVTMACFVLVISCMVVPALQYSVFTIGEYMGWIPGVDHNSWAKTKNFKVGDSLRPSAGHTISSDNSGSTTIPLLTAGLHCFICGVVGHCALVMKLFVDVIIADQSTPLPSAQTHHLLPPTALLPRRLLACN